MNDWKRIAARMRAELERADLNERARALASWAIRPTLLRGRTRVVIPNRAAVCAVLGIGQNHIAGVVQELAEAGIITLREAHEGWELLVYPDASMWSCRMKWERGQMDALLRVIDQAPGQVQGELLEPDPCLDRARAEVAAENVSSQNGKPEVPKMGSSQLTVNSERVHSVTAIKQLSREQLTSEGEVMDLLREFVGEEDVRQWGGDWRKNWLRRHPEAFAAALRTLIEESRTGWKPSRSRGAALKDLTKRYAQGKESHEH